VVINDSCRAGDVIRRVRALAKKSDMETVRLDLNQVVNEAITLVEHELKHGILLKPELSPALPEIPGDRVQLQQVIINLLINGIEAMEPITDRPRELFIRSAKDDMGHVTLSVTDSGIGISLKTSTVCSMLSSPPNRADSAWDCRSAARSWKPTAEICLHQAMRAQGQHFNSSCLSTKRLSDDPAPDIASTTTNTSRRSVPVVGRRVGPPSAQ
jgi:hypothetical protein